jgi:predicted Zn-dependent protease
MQASRYLALLLFCAIPAWARQDSNIEAAAQRARQAMLAGKYEEAARIYRGLTKELPDEPGLRFSLATALYSCGQYKPALGELELIRSGEQQNPKFWFLLGVTHLKLGHPQLAIEPLRRAIDLESSNLAARVELGSTLIETRDYAAAEKEFTELSKDRPDSPKIWQGLAISRLALSQMASQTPEAARMYARLAQEAMARLAALPPSAEQHEVTARVYLQAGRKADALQELREAANLAPHDELVEQSLAEALWANQRYDQAVAILDKLVRSAPDHANWQFELGDSLLNLGKLDEGIQHLSRAVALEPDLLPAQAKLGEALMRTGNTEGAVPHLERAQSFDRDGSIHFQLAQAYRRLGRMEDAAQASRRQKELSKSGDAGSGQQ